MAKSIEDGFKDIFLAGVGALAITGEKAKEVVDTLIEKAVSLSSKEKISIRNCSTKQRRLFQRFAKKQ